MCRYDEDWEWTVTSTDDDAVAEADRRCEDCGRMIAAGEVHTLFFGESDEEGEDDEIPKYAFFAQLPEDAENRFTHSNGRVTISHWLHDDKPFTIIDEEDEPVWVALGFMVFGDDNPNWQGRQFLSVSCAQCRIADGWLRKICNQTTVLVTRMDLAEHWDEYDAKTLGPDFRRLNMLAQQQWQLAPDHALAVAPPEYVSMLTKRAIEHAIAMGLQDA